MTRTAQSTEPEPFVSVVIPCFNSRPTIGDCLQALAQQSYPAGRYEIIVADNGSSDGTLEFVRQHFPQVRVVQAESKGSAYARNAGFAAACGELILSTDADCVADPQWMQRLVTALHGAGEDVAAIGGPILPYSLRTLAERYHKAWVSQPADAGNNAVRYTATPNAIFRASAVRALNGFDGAAGHDDSDLGIRLTAAGHRIVYTDAATVTHRNPVTLRELFQHRRKYGEANFRLARKHPTLLGSPLGIEKRRRLLWETLRRVISDAIKLPVSLLRSRRGYPRGWPVTDAIMALGNYIGFARASKAAAGARSSL